MHMLLPQGWRDAAASGVGATGGAAGRRAAKVLPAAHQYLRHHAGLAGSAHQSCAPQLSTVIAHVPTCRIGDPKQCLGKQMENGGVWALGRQNMASL